MYNKQTIIKTIHPTPSQRILAISDIHGHASFLVGALEKVSYTQDDILIIVGDLIEKGKENLKTVRFLIELCRKNPNVYVASGNVDHHRLSVFLNDTSEGEKDFLNTLHWMKKVWKKGFFLEILDELGVELAEINMENIGQIKERMREAYSEELDFLWNLPTIISAGNYIFVHGGIYTDNLDELVGKDAFTFLKVDAFMKQDVKFEKTVVTGHWPVCLYRDGIDCMNPLFDPKKNIIGIDGGCGLKKGQQLNVLIIPDSEASMQAVSYDSFDKYPLMNADKSQKGREKSILIRYYDSEVEVLSQGNEAFQQENKKLLRKDDMTMVRHISSGREFMVPTDYLYHSGGKVYCEDYSDALLTVEAGDQLSVILETSKGKIVKKNGVVGWYCK